MRNPRFGNKFKFVANTRIHRNLSGDLRTYQGAIPTWEGFTVEYEALSESELATLETFFLDSAGCEVTLVDFEGRTWDGIITSRDIDIIESREGCNWSTSFEFEGQVTGSISESYNTNFDPTIQTPDILPIGQLPSYKIMTEAQYNAMNEPQHNTLPE